MKPGKIFWGVFFLSLGFLYLIRNLTIIDLGDLSLHSYWPLLLIMAGMVYLVKNPIVRNLTAGVAGVALACIIFFSGWGLFNNLSCVNVKYINSDKGNGEPVTLKTEAFDSTIQSVDLTFDGGAGKFQVEATDTNFYTIQTDRSKRKFSVENKREGAKSDLTIKMVEFNVDKSDTNFANLVRLNLNPKPFYENLNLNFGAAEFDLNIKTLQFKDLTLHTGASSTKLILPLAAEGGSEVEINCGASTIEIIVPLEATVQIETKMALGDASVPPGYEERDGIYYSPNFSGTGNVLKIKITGGVSNVSVRAQ
ncbi:MAG: cell wall-active antibiotics response protein [Ignavibacteriales bacterium]|nr:MAG: cell wall-active antibiotics response protein [Ignavibacteriaceae bacterium]MBW7872444.1 hypothetical protein [Ignavibacteria bacterium]MCZ2142235.1 cell wall-active antibiotics response protein [Ignavibacteriales bacterium]OQY73367.1 MAG: hypothetical protein B6D45_08170 [Ignavibacteriales bacterium UTCHB3]MBV6445408.1 hypothetical protein [Ignavibacteriaceae bacterium]